MEWKNGTMVYEEGELDSGGCAPDPKWAASQLRAYGVDLIMKSEKLQPILLCSKVLELAEVPFRVEPAAAEEPAAVAVLVLEEPAAVEVLAPATEFAQAEAGDINVPSEAEEPLAKPRYRVNEESAL